MTAMGCLWRIRVESGHYLRREKRLINQREANPTAAVIRMAIIISHHTGPSVHWVSGAQSPSASTATANPISGTPIKAEMPQPHFPPALPPASYPVSVIETGLHQRLMSATGGKRSSAAQGSLTCAVPIPMPQTTSS